MVFEDIQVANLSAKISDFSAMKSGSSDTTVYHARVLDFQNGKATLEVNGRVVTADSEVPLKLNSEFDLVVRGSSSDGKLTLQVVGARATESATIRPLTDSMISSRLIGFDLPDHSSSIQAAKSLMEYGVPVTKSNMESMLGALPQTATRQVIDFAAALLKEGLPLSREIINLVPMMSQEMEALPANMKAVAESLPAPLALESEQAAASSERPAIPAGLQDLAPLPAGDKEAIIERLPVFVKSFLHSTEAKLNALAETAPFQPPAGLEKAELTDRLVSLIKVIPDAPQADTKAIERAVDSLLAGIKTQQITDEKLAAIKEEFLQAATAAMESGSGSEKLSAVRAAAAHALAAVLESEPQTSILPPEEQPSLFSRMLSVLSENTSDTVNRFNLLSQMFADPNASPTAMKNEVLTLLARLSALQSFKFDSDGVTELKGFIEAAGEWANNTAEIIAKDTSDIGARELMARIAADPQNATLLERLRVMMESTSLRHKLDMVINNFQDQSDLRMGLARSINSGALTQQAAAELARGMQFAGLANLAQHSGNMRMDSFVTYFPIQVDGRIEMGKLKVYRREDDSNRRREHRKPLNPFDAKMVLALDTEFLGLSTIELRTFSDKSIDLDIEVQDKRRRNILDKYSDELREGLKDTSYEQSRITVRVRKRKSAASAVMESGKSDFSSVDFRI